MVLKQKKEQQAKANEQNKGTIKVKKDKNKRKKFCWYCTQKSKEMNNEPYDML